MDKIHKTSPDEKDLKIFELSINDPTITDKEIADQIGMTREAITKRKNREGYAGLVNDARVSLNSRLREISHKAAIELEKLLSDPDPKIRILAISLALKYKPGPSLFEDLTG